MNTQDIIKKLDEMEKTIGYLKKQIKGEMDLNPVQKAVKVITASKSTSAQVKDALDTLANSPSTLSYKQVSFCLFFALMNHQQLGEDINYWFDLQLGKHKYNQRSEFIDLVLETINTSYKSTGDFNLKINNYLNSKKAK